MLRRARFSLLSLLLVVGLAGLANAEELKSDFTVDSKDLKFTNLIGEISVIEATGNEFEIQIVVRGEDAEADMLTFESSNDGEDVFAIRYPLDEHDDYVYPPMGSNSKTTFSFRNDDSGEKSWLKKIYHQMSGKKVTVRGEGRGLEIWADVTIAVPKGAALEVQHGTGEITALNIDGDLYLDISSGRVTAEHIEGNLIVDTGSGRVDVANVKGNVDVDTGSGRVAVSDCEGDEVKVDTGSGSVTVDNVVCEVLDVDTGSGSVKAKAVAADQARIDTGSGSVVLQLDRMGTGNFVIDTGSGSIEMVMPEDASAHITADTGSGSVKNSHPGASIVSKSHGEMVLAIGDEEARVRLDAGSGSIRVKQQ
ncbi:MAG: hypothetical protein ACI9UK_001407 [Candidatus Krumholzibacteriia bacterium]|jgi:hypothetical protein